MGPADSPRISRVLGYSGVHWASVRFRVPGCHRLWLRFPSYSANLFLAVAWILLPHSCRNTGGLGCSAFARHYWRNHCYFLFLRVLRCFSSPRWLTAWRYGHCWPGCPIRIFTGLGLFAPYRNFSQLITSFFASESLGIHHTPLIIYSNFILSAYSEIINVVKHLYNFCFCSLLWNIFFHLSSMSKNCYSYEY